MTLPFSADEFFRVFADYNRQFWPVAALFWVATVVALSSSWLSPHQWGTKISLGLAALWLWNAVAYHALLFTRINRAAWLFAGLFTVQAALFVWAGLHRKVEYFGQTGVFAGTGFGLAVYSMAYPFLTMLLGHAYPAVPTFGVPCPTTILTIGLLLTVPGGLPLRIVVIPILWSLIGGSAALLLGVATDYVLLAAGPLLATAVLVQRVGRAAAVGPMFAPPQGR